MELIIAMEKPRRHLAIPFFAGVDLGCMTIFFENQRCGLQEPMATP
jgi:hypothetical protein